MGSVWHFRNEAVDTCTEENFIITARIMNEISKIISDDSDAEDMEHSSQRQESAFIIGNTEVSLRLMEGEFIRYRDIIPSDGQHVQ